MPSAAASPTSLSSDLRRLLAADPPSSLPFSAGSVPPADVYYETWLRKVSQYTFPLQQAVLRRNKWMGCKSEASIKTSCRGIFMCDACVVTMRWSFNSRNITFLIHMKHVRNVYIMQVPSAWQCTYARVYVQLQCNLTLAHKKTQ